MRRILGTLMLGLAVLPVRAGDAPQGCAWLCGEWVVDAAPGESAETLVDAALQKFKEPAPRKPPRPRVDDPLEPDDPALADPAPRPASPTKAALRKQLLSAAAHPASLIVAAQSNVILIQGGGEERRLYPGEPHSRVSAQGTTRISTNWRKDALVVREDRGGKRRTTDTYTLLPDGGLLLARVVEHPGVKPLRVSARYRRGQTQALESPTAGAPFR